MAKCTGGKGASEGTHKGVTLALREEPVHLFLAVSLSPNPESSGTTG